MLPKVKEREEKRHREKRRQHCTLTRRAACFESAHSPEVIYARLLLKRRQETWKKIRTRLVVPRRDVRWSTKWSLAGPLKVSAWSVHRL